MTCPESRGSTHSLSIEVFKIVLIVLLNFHRLESDQFNNSVGSSPRRSVTQSEEKSTPSEEIDGSIWRNRHTFASGNRNEKKRRKSKQSSRVSAVAPLRFDHQLSDSPPMGAIASRLNEESLFRIIPESVLPTSVIEYTKYESTSLLYSMNDKPQVESSLRKSSEDFEEYLRFTFDEIPLSRRVDEAAVTRYQVLVHAMDTFIDKCCMNRNLECLRSHVDAAETLSGWDLRMSSLVARIFRVFDRDGDGLLSSEDFIKREEVLLSPAAIVGNQEKTNYWTDILRDSCTGDAGWSRSNLSKIVSSVLDVCLHISPELVLLMLPYYSWDHRLLCEVMTDSSPTLRGHCLRNVHIKSIDECPQCKSKDQVVYSLSCKSHWMCKRCWELHFNAMISKGSLLWEVTCPGVDDDGRQCPAMVGESAVEMCLGSDAHHSYSKEFFRFVVDCRLFINF